MKKKFSSLILASLIASVSIGQTATLFFSEYIEGSSNEKYLEIYNGTGTNVSLSGYVVELYANGSITPTNTLSLSGTLNNSQVLVLRNSGAFIIYWRNGEYCL
ncbi:MAG: lamin tail domain-containing protein [Chitinophagaceae bacterium]|nr:lamin tail domain-containing protein [Chitinophagaceae bacterium]